MPETLQLAPPKFAAIEMTSPLILDGSHVPSYSGLNSTEMLPLLYEVTLVSKTSISSMPAR